MKQPNFTTVLGYFLVALSAAGYAASAAANTAAECRQEAIEYGVSPELIDDYVDGCQASRGELLVDEVIDTEYVPPDEPAYEQELLEDPLTGVDDAAQ